MAERKKYVFFENTTYGPVHRPIQYVHDGARGISRRAWRQHIRDKLGSRFPIQDVVPTLVQSGLIPERIEQIAAQVVILAERDLARNNNTSSAKEAIEWGLSAPKELETYTGKSANRQRKPSSTIDWDAFWGTK